MWDKCDKARNKQLKIILFQRPKEKKIGQRKIDCWWKGKETFSLLAKLLHASMHTWPGQSDPRTNCQYGNNLVKQLTRWKGLHINTHTSSRWVNIFFFNPDQSCILENIKAAHPENLLNADHEYLGEKPKCNNWPMKTNAFANISKSLIRPLCLDSSWLEGHWSIMAGPQNHQLSMTMIVVIVIDTYRPSKLTTISTDDRDRC